jgi:methyl-accepting chemotaxis protein
MFEGFLLIALAGALSLAGLFAFITRRLQRLQGEKEQLTVALDHMSQGLCLYDGAERLRLCNKRYMEMYEFSPAAVRPGCTLRDVLQYRIKRGSLSGDAEQYRSELLAALRAGKATKNVLPSGNGRSISVINQPIPGGGWVGTHEDITERERLLKERDEMAARENRRAVIDAAIASFRDRIDGLLEVVGGSAESMKTTAARLATSLVETSQQAQGAAGASGEASGSVRTAATAAEELATSIAEIARQVELTNAVVHTAVSEAKATDGEIAALASAAQKIGDVVKLIREIAGQTNLLALNATIESARAGEAGRGFAVVAAEVKSLALETTKATEEIASQILAVQSSTTAAVGAIRRITERMNEINSHASAVAASVEQQNAATGQIASNVANAARGTSVLVATLHKVRDAATHTQDSTAAVLNGSHAVEVAVSELRNAVEDFLGKVAVG